MINNLVYTHWPKKLFEKFKFFFGLPRMHPGGAFFEENEAG